MFIFEEGGKPETTPRSKGENQQQTQPTYDAGSEKRTRDTLEPGECSHHCATQASTFSSWPPSRLSERKKTGVEGRITKRKSSKNSGELRFSTFEFVETYI